MMSYRYGHHAHRHRLLVYMRRLILHFNTLMRAERNCFDMFRRTPLVAVLLNLSGRLSSARGLLKLCFHYYFTISSPGEAAYKHDIG